MWSAVRWQMQFSQNGKICKMSQRWESKLHIIILSLSYLYGGNFFSLFFNNETKTMYKEGDIMRRPKLAETLEQLANSSDPIKLFYEGELAQKFMKDFKDNGKFFFLIFIKVLRITRISYFYLFKHSRHFAFVQFQVSTNFITLAWSELVYFTLSKIQWRTHSTLLHEKLARFTLLHILELLLIFRCEHDIGRFCKLYCSRSGSN